MEGEQLNYSYKYFSSNNFFMKKFHEMFSYQIFSVGSMLSVRVWMVNNTKCFPIFLTQSPMSASKLHSHLLNFTSVYF